MKFPKKKWAKTHRKPSRRSSIRQAGIKWSKDVKATTGGLCALDGSNFKVQAHHIVRKGLAYHKGWFLLENGIPLCWNCHYSGIHSIHFPTQRDFQERIERWLLKKGLDYETLYAMCKGKD